MKQTLLLLLLLSMLAACENDIDLKTGRDETVLSVSGYLEADSTNNLLYVMLTDVREPRTVDDATVQIRVNGALEETANYDPYVRAYPVTTPFHAGDVVRIDVTRGSRHVFVEETVPQPVGPQMTVRIDTTDNDRERRVRIAFADEGGDRYYRLSMTHYIVNRFEQLSWDKQQWRAQYFNSVVPAEYDAKSDPVLMDGHTYLPDADFELPSLGNVENKYGVFSNHMFRGRQAGLAVLLRLPYYLVEDHEYLDHDYYRRFYSDDVMVTVESILPSEYYYLKALNLLESDDYDDFSDLTGPIKLPTNVHGGTGLVAFQTSRSTAVHVMGNERFPGLP